MVRVTLNGINRRRLKRSEMICFSVEWLLLDTPVATTSWMAKIGVYCKQGFAGVPRLGGGGSGSAGGGSHRIYG